jgi:phage terminase large subunit-like protein
MNQAARNAAALRFEIERRRRRFARLPLMDYVQAVTPEYDPPEHLRPLVELFERVERREEVRALITTPPQHGKSETCFHGLTWLLLRNPQLRNAFATYNTDFSADQAGKAARVASRSHLPLTKANSAKWETAAGGGVQWSGVGGRLTGSPIDGVLLLDDLIKNRVDAESPTVRENAMGFIRSVGLTRLHPGASAIFIATRWHPDDPHGQLKKEGWEYIHLPAVNRRGAALWPKRRPGPWLERVRQQVGEYDWASMYQGDPQPRGSRLIKRPHWYTELPRQFFIRIGLDLAYSANTKADASVAVVYAVWGRQHYILDVHVWRREIDYTLAFIKSLRARYPGATFRAEGNGPQAAICDLIENEGVMLERVHRAADKFTETQPFAAAWARGEILLPMTKSAARIPAVDPEETPEFVDPFLSVLTAFTGVGDAQDDEVDAAVNGHIPPVGGEDLSEIWG